MKFLSLSRVKEESSENESSENEPSDDERSDDNEREEDGNNEDYVEPSRKRRKLPPPEIDKTLLWIMYPKLYPKPADLKFYPLKTSSTSMIRVNYEKNAEDVTKNKAAQTFETSKEFTVVKSEPMEPMPEIPSPGIAETQNNTTQTSETSKESSVVKAEPMEPKSEIPSPDIEETQKNATQTSETSKESTVVKHELMEPTSEKPSPGIAETQNKATLTSETSKESAVVKHEPMEPMPEIPSLGIEETRNNATQTSETPKESSKKSTMIKMFYMRKDQPQYVHKNKIIGKKGIKYQKHIRYQRGRNNLPNFPCRSDPLATPGLSSTENLYCCEVQLKY